MRKTEISSIFHFQQVMMGGWKICYYGVVGLG